MKKKLHHAYLATIEQELWEEIKTLKIQLPEKVSANQLINKGLKVVLKDELLNLSSYKRNKESINAMRDI